MGRCMKQDRESARKGGFCEWCGHKKECHKGIKPKKVKYESHCFTKTNKLSRGIFDVKM